MLTGNDFIALGYQPGKWFKDALALANRHNLSGDQLRAFLDSMAPPPPLPLLDEGSVPFQVNLRPETPDEVVNLFAVKESMIRLMRTPTVIAGAIMPDACPAGPRGTIPVGGVVVTRNAIHPGMHSADICCSVMLTDLGRVNPKTVLDLAESVTHFGPGGRPEYHRFPLPHNLRREFEANPLLNSPRSLEMAHSHLGTQGDGNHFLFVGTSRQTGNTCVVTHHGSRGVGALLYKQGMAIAERTRRQLSPDTLPQNAWIVADSPEGQQYWDALQLVRRWTKWNHAYIHSGINQAIHRRTILYDQFWNEHNFVFRDGDMYYHAKGATPLDPKFLPDAADHLRIIPLNMAEPILIVQGKTTPANLGFAPHGAGRNLSRSGHKARQQGTDAEVFAAETKGIDARFFSGHIDTSELPSAYKDAKTVKRQINEFDLAMVVDEIIPYGCIMAGDWQRDAHWRKPTPPPQADLSVL